MNTSLFRLALLAASLLTVTQLAPVIRAANINWDTPQQISGTVDVSTNGNLIGAFNVGDTGVPSTTVNTVTFQSFQAPGGNGSSGNFTLASTGSFASNTAAGSASPPFSTLPVEYQTLLMSRVAGVFGMMSLTISGLVVGAQYEFQAWVNNSSDANSYDTKLITGSSSVTLFSNEDHAQGGLGQYVIGSFTADAATQSIAFEWSEVAFLNAFQLRQLGQTNGVPESGSTLALLALALGGVAVAKSRLSRVV